MKPDAFRESPTGRLVHTPTGFWAFVPNPLPPPLEWTSSLVTALSEASRAMGELAGLGRSVPNPHLLVRPFVRREAVLSSRIEGTRTSLPDLYAYEAGQLPLFELPEDVREVTNHVRALEYGLTRLETLPLRLRLLREIHGVLMEGVRAEHLTPGEFRRSQNWIGPPGCTLSDSVFVPPPVAEMTGALAELETFLHGESDLPTLVRLGLIHYQFEAIHPFLDGNGRMGRLLVVLLLCTWGLLPAPLLYLSEYLEARRPLYYDLLLAVSQRGAWTEWLEFFLQGLAVQAGDAIARARRLMDLRESYRKRLQTGGASVGLLRLVDVLFSSPILSISHIAGELGIAFPTAMRYVGSLERLSILHEVTGRKRDHLYRADEILAAITDPSP